MIKTTNWYRTRKHWSNEDSINRDSMTSLCGYQVWSEDQINERLKNYRATRYGNERIVIDNIPECKLCARKKAKIEMKG
jgi:hypothetical protein